MNLLRRCPRRVTPCPEAVVSGAAMVAGGVLADQGSPTFDLRATGPGLVVAPSYNTELEVPTLIRWDRVEGATTGPLEHLADGTERAVVKLQLAEGAWPTRGTAVALMMPADLAAPLIEAVAWGRAQAGGGGPAIGAAAASAAAVVRDRIERAPALASTRRTDHRRGAHGLGRRRWGSVAVGTLALCLLAGSTCVSLVTSVSAARGVATGADQAEVNRPLPVGNRQQAALAHATPHLAAATSTPAPDPPALAASAPLQSHEIFGYAPYWTLPQSSGFDVQDLTTLAYFSVDANANGSLDESGAGWNGYESQDLVNLVNRSHAAGDRVVLTVTCFSQSSLDAITHDPTAAGRLSAALIAAVAAKNLDGVNFDFEGEGSADQAGLTALITQVSAALHKVNPHWQVTMATYASAAGDSGGFYNIAALAPALDGFFVMAYDMNNRSEPSATAPLVGGGFNDTEALQQFTSVVPASKVILGVPYYGYDWPTTNGTSTAQATGGETPLSDAVIDASGRPTYWDPSTDTAWTSYQVGTQWHETYFDDPTSLALKAGLANSFHIAGLGIWALGMDGNDPAMLAALLGNAPPAKDQATGPTATDPSAATTSTTTPPPGTGYLTTAIWEDKTVTLTPVAAPGSDGTTKFLGSVHLTTDDPALACLERGPVVPVWSFSTMPGVDVVVASGPTDCATAVWTFASTAGSTSTTTTRPPTTTTRPPTTTTTTAPVPTSTTTTTSPSSTTTTTQPTDTTEGT